MVVDTFRSGKRCFDGKGADLNTRKVGNTLPEENIWRGREMWRCDYCGIV